MFACAPECGWTLACSAPEQFFRAVNRRLLDHVREFAAAVVTLLRIAFRVLVRKDRPHRREHGLAHEILRRDQLQSFRLSCNFTVNGLTDNRVNFGERRVLAAVGHDSLLVCV
jgi:hypothetical protein